MGSESSKMKLLMPILTILVMGTKSFKIILLRPILTMLREWVQKVSK